MAAKIKTSNLSAKHAKLLRLEPYGEDEVAQLDIWPKLAGFKIPYFKLDGKIDTSFFRFRFMQTRPSHGIRALMAEPEKPRRYAQPPNTDCGVYFPPLLPMPWSKVAQDPSIPLLITEGELKAACACALGIPCIGLGGVYNWRSAKNKQSLIPQLEDVDWMERSINLVFDSDIATNPMVRIAASRLATTLSGRGAGMYYTQIPAKEGAKVGLDDYIYENGKDTFLELISKPEELGPGLAFHELNNEVAVILSSGEVVETATGNIMTADKFQNVIYRNRTHVSWAKTGKDSSREVLMPTAKEWLAWPHRTQLRAVGYIPGQPAITPEGIYNTWCGWAVQPCKTGSIAPWEDLLGTLFNGTDQQYVTWLRRWLAWPLVHQGAKLATAVLIWGLEQGTGKTLLGDTMRRIYGKNYSYISNDDMQGNFNAWAEGKQFVVGDEVSIGDKRGLTDRLKAMITRQQITVNVKYRSSYTIPDCINYYFTSQHSDALYLEDQDRRFFVHEVTGRPMPNVFYDRYIKWLDEEGGAARLFYYLTQELPLGDFNPNGRAPVTAAKIEMMMDGKSDLADWCLRLKSDPDGILQAAGMPVPYSLYTSEDLLRFYDPESKGRVTANGLSRELKRAGFRRTANGNAVLIAGARIRMWDIRGQYKTQSPSKASELYEQERAKFKATGGGAKDGKRKF